MYDLSAKQMVEVHLMSQGDKPNQMNYDYDDEMNTIIGDDGIEHSVQEWLDSDNQFLVFITQQPDITIQVLNDMQKAKEFDTDDFSIYSSFYTRMHNALLKNIGNLRFFG